MFNSRFFPLDMRALLLACTGSLLTRSQFAKSLLTSVFVLSTLTSVAHAQQKSVAVISVASEASAQSLSQAQTEARTEASKELQLAVIRESLKEALKVNGFPDSKNFKLSFDTVQASLPLLDSAVLKVSRSRPDVLVVISPDALAKEMHIPAQTTVIQVRLIDPVSEVSAQSWLSSGTPVTGVSNTIALAKRVALIRQFIPSARKVGVIYNPSNPQSAARAKELQEQLGINGIAMIEAAVMRSADVGSAARSLINRVDAFYALEDAHVQNSYAALVKVANDAKMPLFGLSLQNVKAGAFAALVVTDRDVGTQAGRMVAKILRGTKANTITPEMAIRPQLVLNAVAARKQGVVLTEATLKSAVEVFNSDSQERSSHDRPRR